MEKPEALTKQSYQELIMLYNKLDPSQLRKSVCKNMKQKPK
jgi:hypothetical protein